jgi:hypothetical protein
MTPRVRLLKSTEHSPTRIYCGSFKDIASLLICIKWLGFLPASHCILALASAHKEVTIYNIMKHRRHVLSQEFYFIY